MFQRIFDFFISVTDDGGYVPTGAGNVALFFIVLLLFIVMAAYSGSKWKMNIKQLTFSAMAVTLAVVFSFLKLGKLPQGGSITLFSMFFICLISYLYGVKAGLMAGIAYGLINLILDPSIYYPIQMLLDYPIAFGCLGFSGLFSHSKHGMIKGYLLGITGRYVAHVLSGVIFFNMFAPEGWHPLIYSLWYNASYILPDAIVTIVLLLLPPLQNVLKQVKKLAVEA